MFDYLKVTMMMDGDSGGGMGGGGGGRAGAVGKPGVGGGFDGAANEREKDRQQRDAIAAAIAAAAAREGISIERRSSTNNVAPGDEKGGQSQRDGSGKLTPTATQNTDQVQDDPRRGGTDVVEAKKKKAKDRVLGVPVDLGTKANTLF